MARNFVLFLTMKKSYTKELSVTVFFVLLLLALKRQVLQYLLLPVFQEAALAEYTGKSIQDLIIVVLLMWLIKRFEFEKTAGFQIFSATDGYLFLFPLAVIGMGLWSRLGILAQVDTTIIGIYLISCILVGLVEEMAFRGFLQSLWMRSIGITGGVVASALLFGLVHFINLYRDPDNIEGISYQVVFAFSIGIYFGALLLRTKNVFFIGMIHGLINFVFASKKLLPDNTIIDNHVPEHEPIDIFSTALTFGVFLAITACGFYLIRNVRRDEVFS